MEFTGKTIEEAIALGLEELKTTKELVEITVKEEPTKGLFGRTKGKAVIEMVKNKVGPFNLDLVMKYYNDYKKINPKIKK